MFNWIEPDHFHLWRRRLKAERTAGRLTALRRDALFALLAFVGPDGVCPSDAEVAKLAGCSARTVRYARTDARDLGLLTWERTRKPGTGRQGANRYTVVADVPELACDPGGKRCRQRKKGKKERGSGAVPSQQRASALGSAMTTMLAEAARLPDLLAMRRAVFERRVSE